MAALLVRLLDEAVPALQEGTQLLKALNVLMLKILDNCNRTFAFCSLIALLQGPPAFVAERGPDAEFRFSDLVVKCLIKLTKALQGSTEVRQLTL